MTEKQDTKAASGGATARETNDKNGMVDQAVAGLVDDLDLKKEIGDVAKRAADESEVDFVVRVLAAIGGVAKVAELKAKLAELTEPRKLGKMRGKPKSAEELAAKIEGKSLEIAFCDDHGELWGVPATRVAASQFTMKGGKLMFTPKELTITGPIDERGVRQLCGYALLMDGKQVAWCERAGGAMILGPGQIYNLAGDILFG